MIRSDFVLSRLSKLRLQAILKNKNVAYKIYRLKKEQRRSIGYAQDCHNEPSNKEYHLGMIQLYARLIDVLESGLNITCMEEIEHENADE